MIFILKFTLFVIFHIFVYLQIVLGPLPSWREPQTAGGAQVTLLLAVGPVTPPSPYINIPVTLTG